MSSSFFLKGKSRQITKRKQEKHPKKLTNNKLGPNLKNGNDSSESDLEFKKFSDAEDSESDHETPEQKKLRLAKKYLEEIEKEEAKRSELEDIDDDDVISKRLQKDYLEQQGKLKVQVAESYKSATEPITKLVRVKEHRLPLTCVCVSSDGLYAFTGSKCSSIVKWDLKEKKKLYSVNHKNHANFIKGAIIAVALTSDFKYLASSDPSSNIQIWDPLSMKHLHTFQGHKESVTGLVFRKNTHDLYSASKDRTIKIWSLDEMAYVETMFGHQAPITSIDALTRERAVSAGGRDATLRIWKIVEESQLIFNASLGSVDEVRLLDEEHFISGSDNGSLCVWSVLKKKPLSTVLEAHGTDNGEPRWITSLATLLNSDIFASGSYDNYIRLWQVSDAYRKVLPLLSVPVIGFINSMQFTCDGGQLMAAIGQEHKSGRWWRNSKAKNGLYIVDFNFISNK